MNQLLVDCETDDDFVLYMSIYGDDSLNENNKKIFSQEKIDELFGDIITTIDSYHATYKKRPTIDIKSNNYNETKINIRIDEIIVRYIFNFAKTPDPPKYMNAFNRYIEGNSALIKMM